MIDGLKAHGMTVKECEYQESGDCEFAVIWGWKNAKHVKAPRILLMERGHVGDRMHWTSVGWDGLARRGSYAHVEDGGDRWRSRWGHLLCPWKENEHGYVLLLGQVPGDWNLAYLREGFEPWAIRQARELCAMGYTVVYRPHPVVVERGGTFCPPNALLSKRETLQENLKDAMVVVTYNSTAGVEAVLSGIPTVTQDIGAMAWPVTSHGLREALVRPRRHSWAHRLAWTQFSMAEIASGMCVEHLLSVMPEVPEVEAVHA